MPIALGGFPRILLITAAVYLVASFGHFFHNAEYLEQYPNLPGWIVRGGVYSSWLVVSLPCLAAFLAWARGRTGIAFACFAIWGALAYLGLDHYYLAPVSAHPPLANFTIISEVLAGSALLLVSLVFLVRTYIHRRRHGGT